MSVLFKNALILSGNDVIKDGFLGIEGENIDYIGKTRPEKSYDVERDMSGRLLMPGLINAHTHTPMTLLRGVGSGLNLQQWLFDGMSVGSAASFMLTGPATKITNLGALNIVLGMKHFLIYLAFIMVFSFAAGLLVNMIL